MGYGQAYRSPHTEVAAGTENVWVRVRLNVEERVRVRISHPSSPVPKTLVVNMFTPRSSRETVKTGAGVEVKLVAQYTCRSLIRVGELGTSLTDASVIAP